ncbi:MAG TPA: protein-L-isoaspartate O-methyltransferase [Bacteroidales bacterium]|nr:protein-L-isoaspartate O-methyltransferase [Bacteroidales bacterium]
MQDTYRHKGLRRNLVDEIRQKGITNSKVLEAINTVPRHLFMDSGFINFAYKDSAFPIGAGQTISQPYTVAFQTQILDIQPLEKVLEIGTGSGYQTAVLLEMGAKVYTIERQKELYLKAKAQLESMGYHPHFFYGDGYLGMPSYGPYNKILVTAGAPEIPEALIEQLQVGGKLICPVGDNQTQVMTLVEKISESDIKITKHGNFIFVPLLKGTNGK